MLEHPITGIHIPIIYQLDSIRVVYEFTQFYKRSARTTLSREEINNANSEICFAILLRRPTLNTPTIPEAWPTEATCSTFRFDAIFRDEFINHEFRFRYARDQLWRLLKNAMVISGNFIRTSGYQVRFTEHSDHSDASEYGDTADWWKLSGTQLRILEGRGVEDAHEYDAEDDDGNGYLDSPGGSSKCSGDFDRELDEVMQEAEEEWDADHAAAGSNTVDGNDTGVLSATATGYTECEAHNDIDWKEVEPWRFLPEPVGDEYNSWGERNNLNRMDDEDHIDPFAQDMEEDDG
ncbi:hypothetical protein EJ08DRAFT_500365 [Tothia fuscella]|uniref:Uncharacterized protein n=1 Tax=Tothia fuscella TaxID=1048955 RepID=A0A9P4NZ69_9PEZI|nr:hypothetical protein EJ08DRAFT_500365 [Tothia fuscella]